LLVVRNFMRRDDRNCPLGQCGRKAHDDFKDGLPLVQSDSPAAFPIRPPRARYPRD
jgi:hypothetical protein